ncbi:MAG: Ig-like domain-containing protein, partial [Planctomycetes bacterium]|nr:Ig-like domain-containing protein [Planctomycetota bacterium]
MWKTLSLTALFAWFSLAPASAAELKLFPSAMNLKGPYASQRLVLLSEEGSQVVGDMTEQARFSSSNPAVASVDKAGLVRATGDGEAVITATLAEKQTTATVKTARTREPFTWSFRHHVIPLMTKIGCNSGACHGALAGKGGFKLSLRGYAPADDYFTMTRQALGRRVDRVEPAHSLILLKPTMTVPHGGGLKLEVGSADYQILADWIASGAPGPREDDVRIERLEVVPAQAVLKPGDRLQVLVRAWYSDGHAEDVTHWAR